MAVGSGWTPPAPSRASSVCFNTLLAQALNSGIWLRPTEFRLVMQAFHPLVNATPCRGYVERNDCNTQWQHPEAENRQEAEYTTNHEENAEQRAHTARHMIVSPVHDAVGVQRNSPLELGFVQSALILPVRYERWCIRPSPEHRLARRDQRDGTGARGQDRSRRIGSSHLPPAFFRFDCGA